VRISKRQLKRIIRENMCRQLTEKELIGKLYSALSEDLQQVFVTFPPDKQAAFAKKWVIDGMPGSTLMETRRKITTRK
tara:strand:+ start:336 stop:569 length:234 start_codon:yes stop_codon:yes gene_type:complete